MSEVVLPDLQRALDLRVMVERARRLEAEAAVRLQSFGSTLVVTTGVLARPTTLALRAIELARPAEVDVVVSGASVLDRLARMTAEGETTLTMPPVQVQAAWAGITPPRTGWVPVAELTVGRLRDRAAEGVAEVAAGVPDVAGGAAVTALRERVWSRQLSDDVAAPAALALAADGMGFLGPDDDATGRVVRHGSWTRLALPRGQCLTRASLLAG